ncbi:hypothetical protein [Kaistella sp.]|uniref:hypothetical protein n=1 Tax=Kaistella sp. TaxID=2782235 RepID=UPI003C5D7723
MIDKNFYLENLSAFDILIEDDDRQQAEAVVYRVFSMLQRDKIWLRDVATEEEIFEEDAEFLEEVEEELKELDEIYEFRFDEFYKLVQQEMKKIQPTPNVDLIKDDYVDEYEDEDNLFSEEDDFDEDDLYDEEEEDDDDDDAFSHLSDEELNLIEDFILLSAKTRFNFPQFVQDFPDGDEVFVEGEFLLPLIAEKAFGETDTEIAGKMLSSFMMLGYQIDRNELIKIIEQKGKELGLEILAFKIAADSLQQGAHPRDIVRQLGQLLGG